LALKRVIALVLRWPHEANQFTGFLSSLERELAAPPYTGRATEVVGPMPQKEGTDYYVLVEALTPNRADGRRLRDVINRIAGSYRARVVSAQSRLSADELESALGSDLRVIDALVRSLRVDSLAALAAKTDKEIRASLGQIQAQPVLAALENYRHRQAAEPPSRHKPGRRRPARNTA
jgi:hypothetical protein